MTETETVMSSARLGVGHTLIVRSGADLYLSQSDGADVGNLWAMLARDKRGESEPEGKMSSDIRDLMLHVLSSGSALVTLSLDLFDLLYGSR